MLRKYCSDVASVIFHSTFKVKKLILFLCLLAVIGLVRSNLVHDIGSSGRLVGENSDEEVGSEHSRVGSPNGVGVSLVDLSDLVGISGGLLPEIAEGWSESVTRGEKDKKGKRYLKVAVVMSTLVPMSAMKLAYSGWF